MCSSRQIGTIVKTTSVVAAVVMATACDNVVDIDSSSIDGSPMEAAIEGSGRGGGPPGNGGGPCCDEVQHPIVVVFSDRLGDSWTSDGTGVYADAQHARLWLSDFADPTRRDKFTFIFNKERNHPTLLHIDGVFSGPCNELKAGVHAPLASPDMYNTDEGWSGISSLSRIQCARSGTSGWTSVEITECASVAHAGDGRWVVTADACTATVSEIDRRSERRIGEYRISFEFFAQEAG